jgi:RNA polymerase sigma-70 factor (ECF subfamily)
VTTSLAHDTRATTTVADELDFESFHARHFAFVWRSLRQLGADPKTWLYAIARRVAADHRRSTRRSDRRKAALAAEWSANDDAAFDDPVARAQAAAHMFRFLDELDGDKRAVFTLYAFEGLRGPEIAERLAMNLNTVYTRLRIARRDFEQSCLHVAARESELFAIAAEATDPPPEARARAWLVLAPKLAVQPPWRRPSPHGSASSWVQRSRRSQPRWCSWPAWHRASRPAPHPWRSLRRSPSPRASHRLAMRRRHHLARSSAPCPTSRS